MLTTDIETAADIGGISQPGLDLKTILRTEIIPEFMQDVGYTSWRRRTPTLAIGIAQTIVLPNDVAFMEYVGINGGAELKYDGENAQLVAVAEAGQAAGTPGSYYFKTATKANDTLALDRPSSVGVTLRLVYYLTPFFADMTTPVEMNPYIPLQYQRALTYGLRKQICFFRFGQGDPRYLAAEAMYGRVVQQATENKELARRHNAVFAK